MAASNADFRIEAPIGQIVEDRKALCYLCAVPTPEQQRLYTNLAGKLQALGVLYSKELPTGTTSLLLVLDEGKVSVDAYDRSGQKIGTVPDATTSVAFRAALQNTFGRVTPPDPIIATI
jgi:hypothetical protein